MKNKKAILLVLLLLMTFVFVGCKPNKNSKYDIKYFVDGIETTFDLSTYKKGDSTNLPLPILKENETFNGWYLLENLSGDKITNLQGQEKDLTLYGEIIKNEINEIDKALSFTSYQYKLTTITSDYTYQDTYSFDNGNFFIHNDVFEQYYGLVNGVKTYFVNDENNKFYFINENHEDFIYYVQGLTLFDIRTIKANQFVKENEYYSVLPDYLQEVCRLFTSQDLEFDSFKMKIVDNKIQTVEIESSSIVEEEVIKTNYIFEFSEFGNTKFDLPKDALDINDPNIVTPISNIYSLEEGNLVTTEGKITGIYGNNFYISDGDCGILVYMGKNNTFNDKVSLNANVKIKASVGLYSDIIQLTEVTNIENIETNYIVNPVNISNLNPDVLNNLIHELVNVTNLTVTKLPTDFSNKFSDITVECSDGINTISLFISKHLNEESKNILIEFIKTLKVNDQIQVTNGHIGFHNNKYQICLTTASYLDFYESSMEIINIIPDSSILTFDYTVSLNEILDKITIKAIYDNYSQKELDKTLYTVDSSTFKAGESKNYTFKINYLDFSTNVKIIVRNASKNDIIKAGIDSNQYLTVKDSVNYYPEDGISYGVRVGLPSIGKPKVLVIPIEFTDCLAPKTITTDLQKAFFGNEVDTGWESLNSYYRKSSYGKLDIQGTVLNPYNTGKTVKEYEQLNRQYEKELREYYNNEREEYPLSPEGRMIQGALSLNDKNFNYDDYDTNSDGAIDAIYLIYANDYNREDPDSLWWAFTDEYLSEYSEYYDNVEVGFYVFMSYQFLFDEFHNIDVNYNTETIIHETGHLMGLNDYYDYGGDNDGPDGGLGGGDMMDANIGDHNPYSKVMLGWIDPMIVTGGTHTIDLNSFGKSGEAIFIFKEWNNTFFDEYYVIDFYTPDGLNSVAKGEYGLFSIPGIRIYHVDSTLNDKENCQTIFDITKFNNANTSHKQIALVEADGKNDILRNRYSTDADLFKQGVTFKNSKWYDNTLSGFTLKVNSITGTKANITITY